MRTIHIDMIHNSGLLFTKSRRINRVGRVVSIWRREIGTRFYSINLRERHHFWNIAIYGRIKKWDVRIWTGFTGSRYSPVALIDRVMNLRVLKGSELHDQLSDFQLHKVSAA
jgi:hypothetical protein